MNRQQRRLLAKSGQSPNPENQLGPQVISLNHAALQALQSNQPDLAVHYSEQALNIEPANIDAQFNLGVALVNLGQHDRAEGILNLLFKRQQRALEAGQWLCHLYMVRAQLDAAKRVGRLLAKEHPEDIHILRLLLQAVYQLGEYDEYVNIANSYLKLNSTDLAVKMELVSALTKLDRQYEAIEFIKTFIYDNAQNKPLITIFSNLLVNFKRFDEFFEFVGKLESINPTYVDLDINKLEMQAYFETKDKFGIARILDLFIERGLTYGENYIFGIRALISLEDFNAALKFTRYYRSNIDRDSEVRFCLAHLFLKRAKFNSAIRMLDKLLKLSPEDDRLLELLMKAHLEVGQRDKCRLAYENFSHISKYKDLYANYIFQFFDPAGGIERIRTYYEEKMDEFRRLENPKAVEVPINYSQYMFWLHSQDNIQPFDIRKETLHFTRNLNEISQRQIIGVKKREKIRVGYVSGDLRAHVVGFYFNPIISNYDKSRFETYCYYNHREEDNFSLGYKSLCDKWINIFGMSDQQVIESIRHDQIDVLIDLSGHTAWNRLAVFAHKPAPIQATWIGYFNTTGLKSMDYIITDRDLVPAASEYLYTERPLRLDLGSAPYTLPALSIAINALPALSSGNISFGCYASERKFNDLVLRLWSEVLKGVPNSTLSLKSMEFEEYWVREKYLDKFDKLGIDRSRIKFFGSSPFFDYLAEYQNVDLMLGTFPYNTATTCLEALWMGVPEISLRGDMLVSRVSAALHARVGLKDFVADTEEAFVAKAIEWAGRVDDLAEIRASLRGRLENSPMTNHKAFTAAYEAALEGAWRKWCEEQGAGRDA